MEQFIDAFITNHGYLIYPLVLVWTFFEGETIVIIVAAMAGDGEHTINLWLLGVCALIGSFSGDQLFFYLGRHYGAKVLLSRPKLAAKADWAFTLVHRNATLFILSFRFIYGVRNVSPFVIGISGIHPVRFFILNLIAATVWATSFVMGGYLLGQVLELWLKEYKLHILAVMIILVTGIYLINRFRNKPQVVPLPETTSSLPEGDG